MSEEKRRTMLDFQRLKDTSNQADLPAFSEHRSQPDESHTHGFSRTKKRKASLRSETQGKVIRGGPKTLGLPQACDSKNISHSLIVRPESPWDTYRRALCCQLAGNVFIAACRSRPTKVVAIREYGKPDAAKMLRRYDVLDHVNILSARECFIDGDSMYVLVDDLPLTLEHLIGCRSLYPTETELASIVWQILDGLCYLSNVGLEHQSLICRNILLGLDGIIKIASLESCVERPSSQTQNVYIKALASITMELMQKYVKDGEMVGVDDVRRWPVDSDAFEFLSATSTAESIASLRQQPLVRNKHRSLGELVLLARSILLSAKMFHSYEE